MAGTELGKAYVQIVPSAKGLSGSIEKVLSGEANSAGKNAGIGIVGGIKKVVVAGGISATIGKALSEGGKLQQSYFGGLDTIYGKAADKAREYARAAVQAGVSQNNYAEQAVSFGAALRQAYGGDTTKSIEAANKAILDMMDNSAKMGTLPQSIQDAYQGFAKQNYTMLDNLKLGYGGTKSEMERLLADANKINAEQGKITDYSIDNLGDVYDAIHVIQNDLGLTGVAAAEASETFSGSLAAMKAAAVNMLGDLMLGENIRPAMQDLVTTTTTFLFGNLFPAVGRIFASLPEAIGTGIRTGLPIIGQQAASLITALTDGINNNAPKLAAALPGAVDSAIQRISENAPKIAARGGELIKNLGTAIISNAPQLASAAAKAIESLVNYLGEYGPELSARGGELLGKLAEGFIKNLPKIAVAVVKIGTFLVKNLASLAGSMTRSGLALIGGVASGITSGIRSKVSSAMTQLKKAITKPIEDAKEKVRSILDKIRGFFPLSVGRIFSNLKVPHINVSGGSAPFGIGGLGSPPHIGITWNKKAENIPYLFNGATIFGAGESNDEVLYGRQALKRDIAEAVQSGKIINMTNYITIEGVENSKEAGTELARQLKVEMRTA